ncbi:MAG: hypothetical protein KGI75_31125, partial [Rhizobiaceae bacterium]|nr:hypothetical protein [Rhizobiaceae bacterium]
SFPGGAMPRLDGPLDNCAGASVENKGANLLFAQQPIPGRDGDRWLWTPSEGFKKIDSVSFQPDSSKGWAQLPASGKLHPATLLSYGEIARQAYSLLGADRAQYERSIVGAGDGEFDGAAYAGTACTPHMCTEEEALLALDASAKKVYLAWKPMNEKIVVRPSVKEWPPKARAALKDWAAKWK